MKNTIESISKSIKKRGISSTFVLFLKFPFKKILGILDKIIFFIFGNAYLNFRSKFFWIRAKNSFLASNIYYQKQEKELLIILNKIYGNKISAMDIGCGDGKFTEIIARNYHHVSAYDISKNLINKAIQKKVKNINYFLKDISIDFPSAKKFELISCMGVTSAIIDDEKFHKLLNNIQKYLSNDGYLITKDTLSDINDQQNFNGFYVAIYREYKKYIDKISSLGFCIEYATVLEENKKENLKNFLILWKKIK